MKRSVLVTTMVLLLVGMLVTGGASVSAKTVLTIWRGDGTDLEEALHDKQIEEFNKQSDTIEVRSEVFPYGEITDTVRAAASTNSLPDIMFVDGTVVANLAFYGAITSIGEHIAPEITDNFMESAFVRFHDEIYGVNEQEGGLALWARKSHLEEAGVRIPDFDNPWTKEEFVEVLAALKELDAVDYPLNMRVADGPGYVVYAWQPFIRSFGGNWWNEDTEKVVGALNSDKTIEAYEYIMNLVDKGYVNNMQVDGHDFLRGTASLELTGHWQYPEHKEEFGDDLILVPISDFGEGIYTGVGGISYVVSRGAVDRGVVEEAMEFINFALGEEYQGMINDANGALPANLNVLNELDSFKESGDLYLYSQQLENDRFVLRPESPFFPTFQEQIGKATFDILTGADIEESLTKAAKAIQEVLDEYGL